MAERKDKPRPAGEHHGTHDAAEGPADEPAPELTARGVFYRGAAPGTTEFSGALFDSQGRVLARLFRATLPFVLDGSKRGRPPKDARAAVGLVAAFKVELCKQQEAGYPEKKGLARESLGYAERSARTALAAAQKKIDQLFPKRTWSVVFLPQDPFEHVGLPPEFESRGLRGVWITGEGEPPRMGEVWHGRAIVAMVPDGFKPKEQRAWVQWVNRLKF